MSMQIVLLSAACVSLNPYICSVAMSESSDDDIGPPIPETFVEIVDDIGPRIPESSQHPAKKQKPTPEIPPLSSIGTLLPKIELYEESYMHPDKVTQIHSSPETDFIITISSQGEGIVKFWRKHFHGIEFVKSFACTASIVDSCISENGRELCVLSSDKYLRFFDIEAFNMYGMVKLSEKNHGFVWQSSSLTMCYTSLSEIALSMGSIILLVNIPQILENPKGGYKIRKAEGIHSSPVLLMRYTAVHECIVSVDMEGFIEIWNPKNLTMHPMIESKFDSDLFELKKTNELPIALSVGKKGEKFALLVGGSSDAGNMRVKIFRFSDCKLIKTIDETIDTLTIHQNDPLQGIVHLDGKDFSDRVCREIGISTGQMKNSILFDPSNPSDDVLLYSTMVGVKVVDLTSNRVAKLYGKLESGERFLTISIFQGNPKMRILDTTGDYQSDDGRMEIDPLLLCTSAGGKNRFFIFSNRLPNEDRDVFNEQGSSVGVAGGNAAARQQASSKQPLPVSATIHTTVGDIKVELYGKKCRKTVENFSSLSRKKYYDNVLFHRVIKGFMIQTGDAERGDGTGGKSIWGKEFEDEFDDELNHQKPFVLSMANHGPNTNGSQFFITTVPCPWLDKKHTVFGRVLSGVDTVKAIENMETDDKDKPLKDVRILEIKI